MEKCSFCQNWVKPLLSSGPVDQAVGELMLLIGLSKQEYKGKKYCMPCFVLLHNAEVIMSVLELREQAATTTDPGRFFSTKEIHELYQRYKIMSKDADKCLGFINRPFPSVVRNGEPLFGHLASSATKIARQSHTSSPSVSGNVQQPHNGSSSASWNVQPFHTGVPSSSKVVQSPHPGAPSFNEVIQHFPNGAPSVNHIIQQLQNGSTSATDVVQQFRAGTPSFSGNVPQFQAGAPSINEIVQQIRTGSFTFDEVARLIHPGAPSATEILRQLRNG